MNNKNPEAKNMLFNNDKVTKNNLREWIKPELKKIDIAFGTESGPGLVNDGTYSS